jgi:hypothetical protein
VTSRTLDAAPLDCWMRDLLRVGCRALGFRLRVTSRVLDGGSEFWGSIRWFFGAMVEGLLGWGTPCGPASSCRPAGEGTDRRVIVGGGEVVYGHARAGGRGHLLGFPGRLLLLNHQVE